MDDEKFFCLYGYYMPGSARYYTNDKAKCSDDKKYPKETLMWTALSNRVMSKPYFHLSKGLTVDTDIYINYCLQPKLLAFKHNHHGDFNYLFWPDLDGAHYSNGPWHGNLQIFLKLDLWGIFAEKVYEGGWQANA